LMGSVLLRRGAIADAREHAVWALGNAPHREAPMHLLTAIKARQSWWLGLWWRWSAWMGTLGDGRAIVVLLAAYVAYRFATATAIHYGHQDAAGLINVVWLLIVAYSWFGPTFFRRAMRREMQKVELDPRF